MSMDAPIITVVSATTIRVEQHAEAIRRTLSVLPVTARGLLISPECPKTLTLRNSIDWKIDWTKLQESWAPGGHWTITDYSRFMLQGLVDFIRTEFCLTVHWDGYAVNRENWRDYFLDFDYIGAPWPESMNAARVGNGGFSLRSQRWLEIVSSVDGWNKENEDDWACRIKRPVLVKAGLTIAPIDIAAQFSIEHPIPEWPERTVMDTLGFHGHFTFSTPALIIR